MNGRYLCELKRHTGDQRTTRLKLGSLVRKLLLDVLSAKNCFQVHPIALHSHPFVQGFVEKPQAFLPCLHLRVCVFVVGDWISNRDGIVDVFLSIVVRVPWVVHWREEFRCAHKRCHLTILSQSLVEFHTTSYRQAI